MVSLNDQHESSSVRVTFDTTSATNTISLTEPRCLLRASRRCHKLCRSTTCRLDSRRCMRDHLCIQNEGQTVTSITTSVASTLHPIVHLMAWRRRTEHNLLVHESSVSLPRRLRLFAASPRYRTGCVSHRVPYCFWLQWGTRLWYKDFSQISRKRTRRQMLSSANTILKSSRLGVMAPHT